MKIEKEYKNKIFKIKIKTKSCGSLRIKRKNITSEFQLAVDDLITYLKVPVKEFPRYAKYVKEIGVGNVFKIISEIREVQHWVSRERNGKLNKVAYFVKHYSYKFKKKK